MRLTQKKPWKKSEKMRNYFAVSLDNLDAVFTNLNFKIIFLGSQNLVLLVGKTSTAKQRCLTCEAESSHVSK